ncbi:MAG: hypothetical protein RJB38_432 [Pseudomonadota bacterium]|jgi:hypothetical protein
MRLLAVSLLLSSWIYASPAIGQEISGSCNPVTLQQRSLELQQLQQADQDDRKATPLPPEVVARDRVRRMRVGEIFGEGCLKSAPDFGAAALIFQHGAVPEHFFQAFLWSKRAVELGDPSQKKMMAMALDRYLINSGQKQLFGTQAFSLLQNTSCWCLQPVERAFSDKTRLEYLGRTLSDSIKWVENLNQGKACPKDVECAMVLRPTPAGTVPGFW